MDKGQDKIQKFLEQNGWKFEEEYADGGEDYRITFSNGDNIGIELYPYGDKEIVFIGESGDILHLPYNYYALIGGLIELRQIGFHYVSVRKEDLSNG